MRCLANPDPSEAYHEGHLSSIRTSVFPLDCCRNRACVGASYRQRRGSLPKGESARIEFAEMRRVDVKQADDGNGSEGNELGEGGKLRKHARRVHAA